MKPNKKVLIISYYFPPLGMGGTQRVAKFVKYLPKFNWQPVVITVKDVAYYAKDPSLNFDVKGAVVYRTGSLDPQRLLYLINKDCVTTGDRSQSWVKKLINFCLTPDNKILWLPFALGCALKVLTKEKLNCIFTTSPPHSVHLVGYCLKLLTGKPWVADFRDGWTGGNFQYEPTVIHRVVNKFLQDCVVKKADQIITVSEGLRERLRNGMNLKEKKFCVITNGFDEEDLPKDFPKVRNKKFTMTYCGTVSNIAPLKDFFAGLLQLIKNYPHLKNEFQVRIVGKWINGDFEQFQENRDLRAILQIKNYLPHNQALQEIMRADLLILPVADWAGSDFIPGKTFEYLASGKPVLVIGPEVEGVKILQKYTEIEMVEPGNHNGVQNAILKFFTKYKGHSLTRRLNTEIIIYERKNLTKQLANILNELSN